MAEAGGGERRPAAGRRLARAGPCTPACGNSRSTGPRMVRRLNIDGDGQGDLAGHGGEHRAVLVYQLDSYRYWQERARPRRLRLRAVRRELHRRRAARRRGVHRRPLPDRRGACSRSPSRGSPATGWACAWASRGWPPCWSSHRRPGFYLRVLTEGRVEAGDEIVKVASGPEGMTVAEIDALLYLPGHPRERLARRAAHPRAQPGLAGVLAGAARPGRDARAAGGQRGAGRRRARRRPGPGSGRCGSTAHRRGERQRVLADAGRRRRRAAAARRCPASSSPSGCTRRRRPAARSAATRCPARRAPREYRISVKREPHGVGQRLSPRPRARRRLLEVAAPRGAFTLEPATARSC